MDGQRTSKPRNNKLLIITQRRPGWPTRELPIFHGKKKSLEIYRMVHSWSAFSTLSLNWVAWCGGGQKGVYATTTRATATKTSLNNLRCPKLYCALRVPSRLIRQMLAIFLELNSKGLHQSSGKEKKVVVFCSRPRQNVRQFHVVVVQQLAEKCTKKRDARAKLLFCLSKPIAYLLFSLRKLTKVTSLAPLIGNTNARVWAREKRQTWRTCFWLQTMADIWNCKGDLPLRFSFFSSIL